MAFSSRRWTSMPRRCCRNALICSLGGVAEALRLDQLEAVLGLGGLQAVDPGGLQRGQHPLLLARVPLRLAQQPGAGDVHPGQDQGDAQAHERADQVEQVLVVGAVHPQPADVVQFTDRRNSDTGSELR
ncbi:hypothetical protein [Kitasatospora acidiphila]|uniref:hypothetical protein n=1 Tax=Kitasatospora acidiphila TaxID=2567942 RepID=UPI003C7123E0